MKKLILLSLLLVSACTVPVKIQFPDAPDKVNTQCSNLKEVPINTAKLSDVISTVTDNYNQYHECRAKVDAWIEWYATQRQIFEKVQ